MPSGDQGARLRHVFGRAFRFIEQLCTEAAAIIIMGLMVLMVIDVMGRKLFNSPLSGTTEIAEMTLVGIVYLSISHVQRNSGHIKIDLFADHLPAALRVSTDLIGLAASFLVCALVTSGSAWLALESVRLQDYTMGGVRVPIWPAKVVITVGFGLLTLRLLRDLVVALADVRSAQASDPSGREGDAWNR